MLEKLAKSVNSASAWTRTAALSAVTGLALMGMGCASAKIDMLTRPADNLVRPDFVLVHNLAVTPGEVQIDQSISAKIKEKTSDQSQTQQEIALGHAAAKAFTDSLVDNLRLAGIKAAKASDGIKPTDKTFVLQGKFVQINQGNQTVRVLIGFGFGNGDVQALLQCSQGGRSFAKAMVTTFGGRKPGLLVPVAGGAAAGTVLVSTAVAGSATGLSEAFLATVQADASRAAKEVAKKIVQGYINHGWIQPEAMDKLNSFF